MFWLNLHCDGNVADNLSVTYYALQSMFWLNPAPTYPQAQSYPQDADSQAVDKSETQDKRELTVIPTPRPRGRTSTV